MLTLPLPEPKAAPRKSPCRGFRCPPDDWRDVVALAESRRCNPSDVLRTAVHTYLDAARTAGALPD